MRCLRNWSLPLLVWGVGTLTVNGQEVRPAQSVEVETAVTADEALAQLEALRPSEDDLFQEARTLQESGDHGRALGIYFDLLKYYPEGRRREEALVRVAQGYRQLGRFEEARGAIQALGVTFPTSSFQPVVRLLEGEMFLAEKKFAEARTPLVEAEKGLEGDARQRARFLYAYASEQVGKLAEARAQVEALAGEPVGSDLGDYARLRLGILLEGEGKQDPALVRYQEVFADGGDAKNKAEAAVRAGNLAFREKKYPLAVGYFESARQAKADPYWTTLAHGGLIFTHFAAEKPEAVLAVFNEVRPDFPASTRADIFLMVAESYRLLGKAEEAKGQYEFILKEFPKSSQAESAAWGRILVLAGEKHKDLLPETARFLTMFPKSSRAFEVKLLRADLLFDKKDFKTATSMFREIEQDPAFAKLPSEQQALLDYRLVLGLFELKDYKGVVPAAESYLKRAPKAEAVPAVLWLMGQAQQENKQPKEALATWLRLIREYPNFSQAELALWKAGLLAGTLNDFAVMQTQFKALLERFPNTPHAADVHAWLGQCAVELKKPEEGRVHWEQARELDPQNHFERASQQLLRLALARSDVRGVRSEVGRYDEWRKKNPKAPAIRPEVIEWLAFEIRQTPEKAAAVPYFRRVLAETKDGDQRKRSQLALALLLNELKDWTAAVKEWQSFRVNFPDDANRSSILVPLGEASIGVKDLAGARGLAEQILRQNPEGPNNARGRLLLGDIEMADGKPEDAAKLYGAVAILIEDPEITPLALRKAAEAWRKAGNSGKAKESEEALKRWGS
jgi:TolA-binding protein